MRSKSPQDFAEYVPAKKQTLPKLTWQPLDSEELPQSQPAGDPLDVYFKNDSEQPVVIYRIDAEGERHDYGTLERGWFKPYRASAGEVWLVTDKQARPLGYFKTGDESADAIIPR